MLCNVICDVLFVDGAIKFHGYCIFFVCLFCNVSFTCGVSLLNVYNFGCSQNHQKKDFYGGSVKID